MENEILDLLVGFSDEPTFLMAEMALPPDHWLYAPQCPDWDAERDTAEMALPPDHWLYAPQCPDWDAERDTAADLPLPVLANDQRLAVKAALRWAIRAATMNGKDTDFDPDALVQNAIYALCGPYGL